MKEYLLQTGAKKDIREMSKIDMAKSMGLISESEYGGYRAKNFAVLMFAETPNKFIPNAHVEIIREIDGTDKEELATNAILHKEYDTPEYVGIYIYKDRISFVNHNRPLPPVTIEALNRDRSFDRRQYLNKELKDMFFSLNLIESYGSGIRRAKDSLAENGSLALKFYPDNEADNYTNAVMAINAEFLNGFSGSATTKTTIKTATKTTTKTTTKATTKTTTKQDEIIKIIANNPNVSAKEIADKLNLTVDGARYHLGKMRKAGLIRYDGSTKLGQWVIIK
ncbi:ATP-binding protein [Bacteroides heparinolyticus]|uniref:ATP-binding protein n=2 Tax=Prevotella heparinolytica TaxID=28113 RepID=UPI0035A0487F